MKTHKLIFAVKIIAVSLICFYLYGCATDNFAITSHAVRGDCGVSNGSIDVTSVLNIGATGPTGSTGYVVGFPDAHSPQVVSGSLISNVDGQEEIRIGVLWGWWAQYFKVKAYDRFASGANTYNVNFNQSTQSLNYSAINSSSIAGYFVSNDVLGPMQSGSIDIERITIGSVVRRTDPTSIGFADNLVSPSSLNSFEFGVHIVPLTGLGYGSVTYHLIPFLKSNGHIVLQMAQSYYCDANDEVTIRRVYFDGSWQYDVLVNNNMVFYSSSLNPNKLLVPLVQTYSTAMISLVNMGIDFCGDYNLQYAEMTKDLDGSYFLVKKTLGFRYREKYNSSDLKYKIYDWNRDVKVSDPSESGHPTIALPGLSLGTNYLTLNLSGKLQSSNFYVLEVTDPKGEVYKLRFKYTD